MFTHIESYKHLYAKKVLAEWFREAEKKSGDYCELAQFKWRANYGIFEELPFHIGDDPYYFECSEGIEFKDEVKEFEFDGVVEKFEITTPYFPADIDRGIILFVPDVVVFHKGTPRYLFEVVHKNHVSDKKIQAIEKFFGGDVPDVYEVDAEFILRQVGVPNTIVCRHVAGC